jgi:hypothetical protein
MQVATVSTSRPSLRSDIDGWGFEDASLLVRRPDPSNPGKIFIGYTPSPKDIPHYGCVLEMLADGWELLGPPEHQIWTNEDDTESGEKKQHEQWNWWLSRKARSRSSL